MTGRGASELLLCGTGGRRRPGSGPGRVMCLPRYPVRGVHCRHQPVEAAAAGSPMGAIALERDNPATRIVPLLPSSGRHRRCRETKNCLMLNVWVSDPPPTEPAPVMVWLHTGAFTGASANFAGTNGRRLAEETGVIVVAPNYRLGAFGFLVHTALAAEASSGASGNYGLAGPASGAPLGAGEHRAVRRRSTQRHACGYVGRRSERRDASRLARQRRPLPSGKRPECVSDESVDDRGGGRDVKATPLPPALGLHRSRAGRRVYAFEDRVMPC